MRAFLLGVIIIILCQKGYGQELKEVEKRINSGKIFTNEQELKEWITLCEKDTAKLFLSLDNCVIDTLSDEKLTNSIYLLKSIVANQSSQNVKKAAIPFFITAAKSKYSGVSTLSFRALQSIPSSCFGNASIDSVSSLISKYPNLYKEAVLLSGYINNPIFIDKIKSIFPNGRSFSKQERWATYKVLARLGDKEALDFCVKRITSLPLNDQVVDVLYPDMIYIHRKEVYDILIKALNSNDALCSSSNPNSDSKIVCGYRIMELLAPEIEGYPLSVLPSGDLDAADYKLALAEVRAWFAKIGNNYTIKVK